MNGPVDVNNAVSLQWGYPASIFDAALSGWDLLLRRGMPGERYIFNPSGQAIELEDLLCVCRKVDGAWVPCGNPVKDSMATKTSPATTQVVAVTLPQSKSRRGPSGRGRALRQPARKSLRCDTDGLRAVFKYLAAAADFPKALPSAHLS